MAAPSDDRFDEMRRAWIAAHQGWSTIQRRRAEQLGRRVRVRQRAVAAAMPDPHDDTMIPPLWLRTAKSPAAQVEMLVVGMAAVVAPLGWLGGWVLKGVVTALIPGTLRAYPIAALLWSGAAPGAVTAVMYQPGATLGETLVAPWVCVQVAAVPAVAGVYGVAEGWLAVPGSRQWWPLTPPQRALSAADAAEILGGYDRTGPVLLDARRLTEPGERSRL
jgi:hypothetical protein